MVHLYESSIITTKDGLHCQVYSNEHPGGYIIAKPKYIPMDKISSKILKCRYIAGKRMNRLNLWVDKKELIRYLNEFKKAYPDYIYKSKLHKNWFFAIPINKIEKVYDPKKGLKELMSMPVRDMDNHIKIVFEFIKLLLKSGIKSDTLGVTYSTLVGHYFTDFSDINIVVYGKKNYWKLMDFLETAKHPLLRWKNDREWLEFQKERNRSSVFTEEEFLFQMKRKRSEGFFNNSLFLLFCVEEPDEVWCRWGDEEYEPIGLATVEGVVTDNYNSIVRPGYYDINNSKMIEAPHGVKNIKVKQIVYYSRDYILQAFPGERITACGLLERVKPKKGKEYYRIVIGYFDAYTGSRRGKEYIKVIGKNEKINKNKKQEERF